VRLTRRHHLRQAWILRAELLHPRFVPPTDLALRPGEAVHDVRDLGEPVKGTAEHQERHVEVEDRLD
jgi:hypothetical protein